MTSTSVLVVGVGGLGVPVATYLAAAGIGRIGLVDPDRVDASNLHRQVLYGESSVGRLKVDVAAERLHDLNPHVAIETYPVRLDTSNAEALIGDYDLVADGTDQFQTRYLVNDACLTTGRLNVHASIQRFDGQVSVFGAPGGPCYRCLFPEPPPAGLVPSCAEGGVLGVVPGLLGMLQATEVLKLALGIGSPLVGRLVLVDVLGLTVREVAVDRDPACLRCAARQDVSMPAPIDRRVPTLSVRALAQRLEADAGLVLLDVRSDEERESGYLGQDASPGRSHHIPLPDLADRWTELELYRQGPPLVVYCASGVRSATAVRMLRAAGFDQAVSLEGGFEAWRRDIASGRTQAASV